MNYKAVLLTWARWLAFASSATIVLGIAPSQILLGLSLAALIASRAKWRLPPIALPLGLFLLGTLIAAAVSGDPLAAYPQIKKFYVFTQLFVVYTLLRETRAARRLILTWAGCGTASALVSFFQFGLKAWRIHEMHRNFYSSYVTERITGFMSHWYTFSVEEMLVLLMLGAYVFFSPSARRHIWLWGTLAILMTVSILLAETRAVYVATFVAAIYLAWNWRRWTVIAIPVIMICGLLAAPAAIRQRVVSITHPGADDSNAFREILMKTGVRMIKAHPWFGLGPEMPRKHFMDYLDPATPRPLPSGSFMHLHNIYLEYAAERGIPVLLIYFWLIGKILWDFSRGLRALPPGRDDRRFLLHGGIAMVISLLIEGFADVNLGDSEILTMFLVIVALGYNALGPDAVADSTLPSVTGNQSALPLGG